jgi:hypothetical protein
MSNNVYKEPRAWLVTLATMLFVVLWCDWGVESEKQEIREEIALLEKKISKMKRRQRADEENQTGLQHALEK